MAKRNNIFNNIAKNLKDELKVEESHAKVLAKQTLLQNRFGNGSEINEVPQCEEEVIHCDSFSKFRTITGVCNNLNYPRWGAAHSSLLREIIIGDYDTLSN